MGRYKWDKTNHVLIPISNETSNFTGTAAEWNALVAAEKAKYKTVDLTDDFNGVEVIDNLSRTTYSGEPLSARMGNSLGKMVANIESTSTASQLYKVNDQFVYNGILYKVTSQIASGGAITPGSNCTPAPSVTSQISNLANSLIAIRVINMPGVAVAPGEVSDYRSPLTYADYTIKGIVGVQIAAGGSCTLVSAVIDTNNNIFVRIRNNGTVTTTPDVVAAHALFVKNY